MCGTCGCGHSHQHSHEHAHGHDHHEHGHHHHDTEKRRISVELDLLASNNRYAAANRQRFDDQQLFAVNLVSGPGAGKTTLLEAAVRHLAESGEVFVIEGDQQTTLDADRITAAGAKAKQINTGAMCHLDAHMVGHAVDALVSPGESGWLLIENVGNLVCPAAFDLGEHKRVALLSVTEGDDKPLKYPDMFASSHAVVISKCDLAAHVPFDLQKCREAIATVNPEAEVFELSAVSGEGMDSWLNWLTAERALAANSGTMTLAR